MNKLLLALLLTVSTSVMAAGYEDNVRNQQICEKIGELSAMVYKNKTSGKETNAEFEKFIVTNSNAVSTSAYTYAHYEAKSEHDAYMTGWGKCMDYLTPQYIIEPF